MTATIFGDDTDPKVATTSGTIMRYYNVLTASTLTLDISSSFTFVPGTNSLFVSVNGAWLAPTVDYTENPDGKGITFTAFKSIGDKILIWGLINISNETVPDTAVHFSGATPTSADNSYAWDAQYKVRNSKGWPAFCKGDGITDDTAGLKLLFGYSGRSHLVSGTYLVSEPLECQGHVTADPGVQLRWVGPNNSTVVTLANLNGCSISGIYIQDTVGPASGNTAVNFYGAGCTTNNMQYSGFAVCEKFSWLSKGSSSNNAVYDNFYTAFLFDPVDSYGVSWNFPNLLSPNIYSTTPLIDIRASGLTITGATLADGASVNTPLLKVINNSTLKGDIRASFAGPVILAGAGNVELTLDLNNCAGTVSTASAGTVTTPVYITGTGVTTLNKVNLSYTTFSATVTGMFVEAGKVVDLKGLYVNNCGTGVRSYGNLNMLFPRLYSCTTGLKLEVGSAGGIVRPYYFSCTTNITNLGTSTVI